MEGKGIGETQTSGFVWWVEISTRTQCYQCTYEMYVYMWMDECGWMNIDL